MVRIDRRHRLGASSAFSLIELLLVLVIIAVLAGLVVPKFAGRSEQARITAAKADIARIEMALDAFEIDNGRYPGGDEGLQALVVEPANAETWHGPYLKQSDPKDPWGNRYLYVYPGQRNINGFDLYCYGPDGTESNDDITNWSTNNTGSTTHR